jgi:hypothetical protein
MSLLSQSARSNRSTAKKSRKTSTKKIKKSTKKKNELLPRSEESFLLSCLVDMISLEKDVEMMKINLSLKSDFNLMDAFGMLDRDCRSEVNPTELRR